MLGFLNAVLWPIKEAMRFSINAIDALTGSAGLAIILMCLSVLLILLPLQRWARTIEEAARVRADAAKLEVQELKRQGLKGERLFLETEKTYKRHKFHPIQTLWQSLSFLILLPVLISALLLFTEPGFLEGRSFLMISDLSKPDGLLAGINILPVIMALVTVVDARVRFKDSKSSQYRFYVIAAVLFVLVYPLPASLILYWTTSNVFSCFMTFLQSSTSPAVA
jgi:membrane protein insertase Oxa1/YidC/SpoIIIJ